MTNVMLSAASRPTLAKNARMGHPRSVMEKMKTDRGDGWAILQSNAQVLCFPPDDRTRGGRLLAKAREASTSKATATSKAADRSVRSTRADAKMPGILANPGHFVLTQRSLSLPRDRKS